MRKLALLFLAAGAVFASADTPKPPLAYSSIRVNTYDGKTTRTRVYTDGVRTKSVDEDGKSGTYRDDSLHTSWQWGPGYGCIHMPDVPSSRKAAVKEETLGTETVDGHPTKKVKKSMTWTDKDGKVTTTTYIEWVATDLQDFVIHSKTSDGKWESRTEKVVLGRPAPEDLAFPSPPCDANDLQRIATAQPQAPGRYRTIRFDQGACEFVVPFPIAMSIPSDYEVRSARSLGCFWGAGDDLTRMLQSGREANFESIDRGVFWVRPSQSTEYDPVTHRFVSEAGSQEKWADAYRAIGAKNVVVTPKAIGAFPATTVTLTAKGERVYMLYLSPPNVDTVALLISYHPRGKGNVDDDTVWKTFIDSLKQVKN